MKRINYDEVREAWIKHGNAEGKLWLSHIDDKGVTILNIWARKKAPLFEQAELLFNIFSYLNWLAHIDLREYRYVSEKDMVTWLQDMTHWPPEVVETFWFCLRNPIMHTGRTSLFSDYERGSTNKLKLFGVLHPDLTFDPKGFQSVEYKPNDSQDGWLNNNLSDDPKKIEVTFYLPGIRRKLDKILDATMQNIARADNNSISSLEKVNRKILAFRIIGN